MAHLSHRQGDAHSVVIIGLVVALIGALGFIAWQNFIDKPAAQTTDQQSDTRPATGTEESHDTDTSADAAQQSGTIQGRAIYPSEGYPTSFRVCAVANGNDVVCDNSMAGAVGPKTYSISLAPGSYQIVARTAELGNGYYDGYMKSGMTADLCMTENHTPLTVTVAAGATVTGIDAGDFYYHSGNC